jgi:hypothetical protein
MQVGEVKVSKQSVIIEVPHLVCVICHGDDEFRYVVVTCNLMVLTLVHQGIQAQQGRPSQRHGDG